jgi:hypothetical protein
MPAEKTPEVAYPLGMLTPMKIYRFTLELHLAMISSLKGIYRPTMMTLQTDYKEDHSQAKGIKVQL